jgi:polar amino acid transport system substrate-binding protein
MKKISVLLLTLAILASASLFTTGCASDDETLLIGITNYIPMNYLDENGNWTGFETEFAQEVGRILGYKVEFIEIDWSALITEVNSGTVDAIWNGMSVLPHREEAMDISMQYMRNRTVMVARADEAAYYTTPAGAANAVIVVENGSAMHVIVSGNETSDNNEFFDTLQDNVTTVETQIMSLMEVLLGTADIAVVDYVKGGSLLSAGTDYDGLVIVDYLFPQNNFGVGLAKGSNDNPDAKIRLDDLNNAIQQLKDSGWLMELARKYGLGELLITG